jgi:hypothetical protein
VNCSFELHENTERESPGLQRLCIPVRDFNFPEQETTRRDISQVSSDMLHQLLKRLAFPRGSYSNILGAAKAFTILLTGRVAA